MVMPVTRHYTAADLATMPDDGLRYEVVRGELLVTPSPGGHHQPIVTRLLLPLGGYLDAHGLLDQLLTPPADITLRHDTLVQPDLLVADTAPFIRSGKWTDVTTLFLAVEVISPSSVRTDRELKRPEYQQHGIAQYWIVDGDQRQVEVWAPDANAPVIERERLRWRHPALDEECVIDLERLFDFEGVTGAMNIAETTHPHRKNWSVATACLLIMLSAYVSLASSVRRICPSVGGIQQYLFGVRIRSWHCGTRQDVESPIGSSRREGPAGTRSTMSDFVDNALHLGVGPIAEFRWNAGLRPFIDVGVDYLNTHEGEVVTNGAEIGTVAPEDRVGTRTGVGFSLGAGVPLSTVTTGHTFTLIARAVWQSVVPSAGGWWYLAGIGIDLH